MIKAEVLLVEDSMADAELVRRAMGMNGHSLVPHRLHHVKNGEEALNFLYHEPGYEKTPRPDLILLDMRMPRVNGPTVLRKVKSDEDLKSIPIVVMTSSADQHEIRQSYRNGANAYVVKPLTPDEFKVALHSIREFWLRFVEYPRFSTTFPPRVPA